jgi:hypothetical protein
MKEGHPVTISSPGSIWLDERVRRVARRVDADDLASVLDVQRPAPRRRRLTEGPLRWQAVGLDPLLVGPRHHPAVRAGKPLVRREPDLHRHVSRSVRRRPIHGLDVRRKHVLATAEEPGRQKLVIIVEVVRGALLRPQPLSIDEEVDFGNEVVGCRLRDHPPRHRTRKSRAVCNRH